MENSYFQASKGNNFDTIKLNQKVGLFLVLHIWTSFEMFCQIEFNLLQIIIHDININFYNLSHKTHFQCQFTQTAAYDIKEKLMGIFVKGCRIRRTSCHILA